MDYSNKDLARDYFGVVREGASDLGVYRVIMKRIENSTINFCSHYQDTGCLTDLKISGIGTKTIKILESRLEKGVEETRKILPDERLEQMKKSDCKTNPRKTTTHKYVWWQ